MNAKIAACLLLASIICSATFRATVAEEPRISAYVHLDQCIDADFPEPQRERQIEQMIASMHETGVEAVVPYVSTTSGVAHYPSEFLPERRWGDWNPVKTLISAARRHGLQVYLCVPVLACGHDKPAGILQQHPEWALRDTSGQPIGSISPGHPEARRWVVDWLGELVDRYRPDGILLDYMRYASQETQVDKVSTEKLSVVIARQRDADKADVTQSFREQLLTELMEMVSTELRQRQPDLRIAIYSWGYHVTDNHRVAQAWPIWAERGYIDEVNVSGYWYPDSFSRRFGATYTEAFQNALAGARRLLKESKSDARLTFALGVRTSHGQVESVDDIARYLVLAKALDVDGTVIFTWSYLQPFLPELVQAGVLQNFASPRVSQDPTAATLLVATADSGDRAKRLADFVGDGKGDQQEINAAIQSLPAVGGTVQLAEGSYDIRKVDSALGGVLIDRSNVVLAGRGSATKLVQAAGQDTNVIRIIGSGVHHVTIRDLAVDANRDENNQGQGDPNLSHDRYEFCGIKGYCRAPGEPAAEDLQDITIRNCIVRDAHRLGIMLEGINLQVIDNKLGNAGSDSVELLTGPGVIRGNYVEITEQTHVAIGSDRGNSIQMLDNIVHVKSGGKLDIGFRTWADSQRHVINGNVLIVESGGQCGLAMDLRGQLQTVTGNSVNVSSPESKTELRIGGGNTVLTGNLLKNVTVVVEDAYDDNRPIVLQANVLEGSTVEHHSGNLQEH